MINTWYSDYILTWHYKAITITSGSCPIIGGASKITPTLICIGNMHSDCAVGGRFPLRRRNAVGSSLSPGRLSALNNPNSTFSVVCSKNTGASTLTLANTTSFICNETPKTHLHIQINSECLIIQ